MNAKQRRKDRRQRTVVVTQINGSTITVASLGPKNHPLRKARAQSQLVANVWNGEEGDRYELILVTSP